MDGNRGDVDTPLMWVFSVDPSVIRPNQIAAEYGSGDQFVTFWGRVGVLAVMQPTPLGFRRLTERTERFDVGNVMVLTPLEKPVGSRRAAHAFVRTERDIPYLVIDLW